MAKNFNFWCPIDTIKKAKDAEGRDVMRVAGIASTKDKDSDDESLDPAGFNLEPFLKSGFVNYHHQQKNTPKAIIGEPHSAKITKAGMYVECDLYPDSELAQDVYQTMKVLNKNSKTRRMGFSIEGHATERDILDDTKVLKADITGLAITPQPKNSTTFAEIVKAMNTGEELPSLKKDDEDEGDSEKATDTNSGAALKKEDLDNKLKNLTKAEVYQKIFSDFPGIEISISKQIFNLIQKAVTMAKKNPNEITPDDIKKAYDALGINSLEKAKKDDNPFEGDEEEGDEEKEKAPKKKPGKKMDKAKKPENDEEEEDDEEEGEKNEDDDDDIKTEDEKETVKKAKPAKKIEKAVSGGALGRIEKAVESLSENQSTLFRAIGLIVKAQQSEILELRKLVKGQNDTLGQISDDIEKANDSILELGESNPGKKSLVKARERNFDENRDKIEKGGEDKTGKGVILKSNKVAVLDILDKKTFEKGYDEEFSQATRGFEAAGMLSDNVVRRLKEENGITIR